jgi:phosphotransferase system enzyme I (PtsP)
MKKDNVELICNISEISGMFKEKGDVRGFLQKVVQTIAEHMRAEVCSIYLLNDSTGRLVLEATEGLNREMVGQFSLDKGEGLVGRSFIELRPILEERATRNPFYKFIPEIGEETFEAFLAVPIMLGLSKIGVLVLQHTRAGFFEQSDSMALKAIASQLAATLENVRLIMSIRDKGTPVAEAKTTPDLIKGASIVGGISFGKAFVFEDSRQTHGMSIVCHECYGETLSDFGAALDKSANQLEELQAQMEEDYSDVASLIFSAHILMLRDESYSGAMKDLIKGGVSPFQAVIQVSNKFIDFFAAMDNPRLQEKTQDIKDLSHRLLRNLSTDSFEEGDYTGQIIIAAELFPSELIKLAAQHVEGLVLVGGNASAHVSILAKSLGVPTIISDNREAFQIHDNAPLILDANQGNLFINPSEETLEQFRGLQKNERKIEELADFVKPVTRTADGQRIHLLASINLLSDLKAARALKAEGVGLYRSEFPFLIRNDFPTEEEQFMVYRKLIESCGGGFVTLRALDIGGDKILSYLPDSRENNPFLGLRAIRFLLQNKKIFVGQLKAMLRAGLGYKIKILFPLVSSLEDFQQAKRMVSKSMEFLERDGLPYNKNPELGAMIELPSAVECVEDLASEADFLSIGSNDLVQYMLGVDRTNDRVAGLYQMEHPAILRAVKRISDASRKKRCELAVCGNLTGNFGMLYYFIGLGIKQFSLNPGQIPEVQQFIETVDRKKAAQDVKKLVKMKTTTEIQKFLSETIQTPSVP